MTRASSFKTATVWKQWWFTRDEVCELDKIRSRESRPSHVWVMRDATPSLDVDTIALQCDDHCVCITKRMNPETGRAVYDITADGEKMRMLLSFVAAKASLLRVLQLHDESHDWFGRNLPDRKPVL